MLKYLIINKGQKYYHSIGQWTKNLSTVNKNIEMYEKRGLDVFVLERKNYYCIDMRIKKRIEGKWHNTTWINLYNEIWCEFMYYYANEKENNENYIKYRQNQIENFDETPSITEWILHNEWEQREFIYWLYKNGHIRTK